MIQIMQISRLRCVSNYLGQSICAIGQCESPPVICNQELCDCRKYHQGCCLKIQIKPFILKMRKKEESSIFLLEEMKLWYEQHITRFKKQVSQIEQLIKEPQWALLESKSKLYKLIKDGDSQRMTPQLLKKVAFSLPQRDKFDAQNQLPRLKALLMQKTTELNNILERMKELGGQKRYQPQLNIPHPRRGEESPHPKMEINQYALDKNDCSTNENTRSKSGVEIRYQNRSANSIYSSLSIPSTRSLSFLIEKDNQQNGGSNQNNGN